jgi:hypothetical protein
MNPTCCKCSREMKCAKNGVRVAPVKIPNHQRSGDKYQCEECGQSVVVNFSKPFESKQKPNIHLVPDDDWDAEVDGS